MPDELAEPSELRIKPREYQTNIVLSACKQNTLVILPTGLGKTIIAMLVAEFRLGQIATADTREGAEADRLEGGVPRGAGMRKVLVMAPTKPLTVQHRESFRSFFVSLPESSFRLLTGDDDPQERRKAWEGVDDAGKAEGVGRS